MPPLGEQKGLARPLLGFGVDFHHDHLVDMKELPREGPIEDSLQRAAPWQCASGRIDGKLGEAPGPGPQEQLGRIPAVAPDGLKD